MAPVVETFWPALERLRGLRGVPALWREHLGPGAGAASRYLRPTDQLAGAYPCLQRGGCGLPHRIVAMADDDIVAVSTAGTGECDELTLRLADVRLVELNRRRVAEDVAKALAIEPEAGDGLGSASMRIGTTTYHGASLPVYFGICANAMMLEREMLRIRGQEQGGRVALLLPTMQRVDARLRERLAQLGILAAPLQSLCPLDANGKLHAQTTLSDYLQMATPLPMWEPEPIEVPVSVPVEAPAEDAHPYRFVERGDHWEVAFEGHTFHLKRRDRIEYLLILLRQPGVKVSAIEMVSLVRKEAAVPTHTDLGECADETYVREAKQELLRLRDAIGEAREYGFHDRLAELEAQQEAILERLQPLLGLGGKRRKTGSVGELFRKRVSNGLARALKDIKEHSPAMALHLRASIRKGAFCSYHPQEEAEWRF